MPVNDIADGTSAADGKKEKTIGGEWLLNNSPPIFFKRTEKTAHTNAWWQHLKPQEVKPARQFGMRFTRDDSFNSDNVKSFLLKYFNKFKVSNGQQHEQPFPNLTIPNAILLSYCITRPWLYTNQYPAGRVHLPVQCAFFQATRIKGDMVKAFMTRKFAFCYFITYEYNKDLKSQIVENIFSLKNTAFLPKK